MSNTVQIQSGGGGGVYGAGVSSENRLLTESAIISDLGVAAKRGKAYGWTAVTKDAAAGDTVLLVVNTSSSENLIITDVWTYSDVATQYKLHCPAAATWAGDVVVGAPMNRTNISVAPATGWSDETGNTFAAANSILTIAHELTTAGEAWHVDMKSAVILGENQALALDIVAEMAAFECTFWGYYYTP